jgi:hypothetical protein
MNDYFSVKGISYYQDNLEGINAHSELSMCLEPDNEYDNQAIAIFHDNKKIGYVPKEEKYKELALNNIDKKLKIYDIGNVKNTNIIYIKVKINHN